MKYKIKSYFTVQTKNVLKYTVRRHAMTYSDAVSPDQPTIMAPLIHHINASRHNAGSTL